MLHHHQVLLSLLALSCVTPLMVAAPKPAVAEPRVLPLAQGQTAGKGKKLGIGTVGIVMPTCPHYRYDCCRPFWHSILVMASALALCFPTRVPDGSQLQRSPSIG